MPGSNQLSTIQHIEPFSPGADPGTGCAATATLEGGKNGSIVYTNKCSFHASGHDVYEP